MVDFCFFLKKKVIVLFENEMDCLIFSFYSVWMQCYQFFFVVDFFCILFFKCVNFCVCGVCFFCLFDLLWLLFLLYRQPSLGNHFLGSTTIFVSNFLHLGFLFWCGGCLIGNGFSSVGFFNGFSLYGFWCSFYMKNRTNSINLFYNECILIDWQAD